MGDLPLHSLDELGSVTVEEAVLIAAAQAGDAVSELLRFLREGAYNDRSPFYADISGKLAEALKLVLDIEHNTAAAAGSAVESYLDHEEFETIGRLREALGQFIAGWVG